MATYVSGRPRPSQATGFALHADPGTAHRDLRYRELPPPTGEAPFHLDLETVLPAATIEGIKRAGKLTFHVNGDMGGIRDSVPQTLVAKGMESDFAPNPAPGANPSFLYVLGDCVYFNGEVKEYYAQFYQPYEFYPAPIFAVPGNHDGENLPDEDTLQGFMRNFCAAKPVVMPEAGDSGRTAMVQPNVYWVLDTPFASFLGLYSNVPEGGAIRQDQQDWLVGQLKELTTERPVLLCLHHPVYSADDHHSGSTHMKEILDEAFSKAKRTPELILAGHVHNYQRLTRPLPAGKQLPYLVAGAGGYHNLHHVKKVDGESMVPPVVFDATDGDAVTLERYCDDHHGFLRLEVDQELIVGRYYSVPRPQDSYSKPSKLQDYFEFDWRNRKYRPNTLG